MSIVDDDAHNHDSISLFCLIISLFKHNKEVSIGIYGKIGDM